MIRLGRPDIDDLDIAAVAEVLRDGQLVQAGRVAAFEHAIAAVTGVTHVAAVSNGTAALQLALLALGVERGDRVAVPTFSWPATANAVVLCGATPVFVDIEPRTLGMNPEALRSLLVRGPALRAVLPIHAFGRMANVVALSEVAGEYGLPVIEDAACALGATTDGRAAGAWGVMGTFSFHPRKAATTGEGGAVTCRETAHLRTIRILRNHGLDPDATGPDFVAPGFNLRLTEFQAALGITQLAKYDTLLAARRRLARRYDEKLHALPLSVPDAGPPGAHVYQSYVALLHEELAPRRDSLIAALRERGVEATIGTYHMPLLSYFRRAFGHRPGDHPVSESIAARAMALPLHRALRDEEQDIVVDVLREELER